MKHTLIILAVFFAAISALHAQIIADPAIQQAVSAVLPPSLAAYATTITLIIMLALRIRKARSNGLSWPASVLAAFDGTNVPAHVADAAAAVAPPPANVIPKASLLLASLCMLSLTSCAGLTAFIASPLGQTTLVTAEALGKQLANAAEETVIAQIITKATGQMALLQAQGVNADTAKEIVRQSELAGLQAVITAAQNQYIGMTGGKYVIPMLPAATTKA